MTVQIRVVMADDHPTYRDRLVRSMTDGTGIEVVGVAGEEAVRQVRTLQPDLVLLDVSMPKGGGLGALAAIVTLPDAPHVAMLTASELDADLTQAITLGALGYILKGIGAGKLIRLVRELAAGRPHVSPALAGRLLVAVQRRAADPLDDLTRREDILNPVATGKATATASRPL